jgi:hypothetical protein
MKHFVFLSILFFSFSCCAREYYEAKATKVNGKVINGYFEIPKHGDVKEVKYRLTEDGKKLSVKSDELVIIDYIDNGKISETFMRKKVAKTKMLTLKIKGIEKKMIWTRVGQIHDNGISTFTAEFKGYTGGSGGSHMFFRNGYIQRPGEDFIILIEPVIKSDLNAGALFKIFKARIDLYLKDICPKICDGMTKEEYKKMSVFMIPKFYELNCK